MMNKWFDTSLGQHIVKKEIEKCVQLVPSGYYARSLQIGFPRVNFLQGLEISSRYIVDTHYPSEVIPGQQERSQNTTGDVSNCHYAVSSCDALPFAEKTHDLVVLPHTLDFCVDSHEVLRQTSQILVPEGCVVIVGFNAISFYGAIKVFRNQSNQSPWNGHYFRVGRVQDWLALLGFDLVGAGMTSYQPPIQSEKWRDKLSFIENFGDRWFPGLAGIYVIVGRKRQMAVTPLPKSNPTWRRLISGIAQPASQRAAKISLKLVPKN